MEDVKTPSPLDGDETLTEYVRIFEAFEGTVRDENGNGKSDRVLAFASSDGPIARNGLVNIRNSLDNDDNYTKMTKARRYSDQVSLIFRLSHWRASLWSRGFQIIHQHKTVEQAYRNLADRFDLPLNVSQLMRDLSIVNNATLIFAESEDSADLAYLKLYHPESTRIEILKNILWLQPSAGLKKEIQSANNVDLEKFIKNTKSGGRRHAEKLVKAIKFPSATAGQYSGYIPLTEEDKEYWQIIQGSGGSSQQAYDSAAMQSIFTDIELLQMLIDGDWATAFLLKNMIMIVKVGESIDGGPLQGSRRNWAKSGDVANLKAQVEKTGKAQILYGNHTIAIEFAHPEPTVFSPEKYDAVINRICTFFGIGHYMILGASSGSSRGASYAAASWNVQAIRTEAREKREIVNEQFKKLFSHEAVMNAAFINNREVYWHDCFASIEGQMLKFTDADFKNLSRENIGVVQYSRNGFSTAKTMNVKDVLVDNSSLVLSTKVPSGAEPEHFRLFLTGRNSIDLLGPPDVVFNERGLKEDRQVLQEVQFAKQDGLISQLTAAQELGWRFDAEIAQKARELEIPELLVPIFEKNQGMALAILQHALGIGMDMVDGMTQAPGESGRPNQRPEGQQDTNEHPRPSTASIDHSDEDLAEMKIAVWDSLKDVPDRLKTLHGAKLTLAQINSIAKQAEGAEKGGAENGWAVARAHFQETHHKANGRWVKKKNK